MELIEKQLRALGNLDTDIMALSGESFPAEHHHHQHQNQHLQTPQLPINNFTDINVQSLFQSDHDHQPNAFLIDQSMALNNSDFGDQLKKEKRIAVGRKRKLRSKEKDVDKSNDEVIHVRAKRGQATDSHSLAERVRREKINERLRCLQNLVPGCYKTMGMAVMLDVVINYVQSLQTQIEFLSMKLSAASMYYDFNSPNIEAMDMVQGTNATQMQEMEKMMMREGYGGVSNFHSTWPL